MASAALGQRPSERSEQLEHLRRQMASMSGKAGGRWRADGCPPDVLPSNESLLPVPESLAGLLPGGLPRGAVAVLSGARSLPVSMAAAVTAAEAESLKAGIAENNNAPPFTPMDQPLALLTSKKPIVGLVVPAPAMTRLGP